MSHQDGASGAPEVALIAKTVSHVTHALAGPLQQLINTNYRIRHSTDDVRRRALMAELDTQIGRLRSTMTRLQELPRVAAGTRSGAATLAWASQEARTRLGPRATRIVIEASDDELSTTACLEVMAVAIHELLDNALVHGPADTEVRLAMGHREDLAYIEVSGGAGDRFPPRWSTWGVLDGGLGRMGFGLLIADLVASAHGGSLCLDKTEHQEPRARITWAPKSVEGGGGDRK